MEGSWIYFSLWSQVGRVIAAAFSFVSDLHDGEGMSSLFTML